MTHRIMLSFSVTPSPFRSFDLSPFWPFDPSAGSGHRRLKAPQARGTENSGSSALKFVELVETNPGRLLGPHTQPPAHLPFRKLRPSGPLRLLAAAWCFAGLACLLARPVAAEQAVPEDAPDAVTKHLLSTMQGCGAELGAPAAGPECSGNTIESHIAMARLARWLMGPFWDGLGSEKQADFEQLLAQLLRALVYQRASEFLATTRFEYGATQTQGNEALVEVAVVNAEEERVALSFRLNRADGNWQVWDVWLDGVSLANNIRKQVQSVMAKHSYDELGKRMRQKIDDASID